MTDTITLTGFVATEPKHVITTEGLSITNFRLASPHRKFDRIEQKWVDAEMNFYSVAAFRQLATNCSVSIKKGERVVVTGRVKIREWKNGEATGVTVEIEADAVGHDLAWGSSTFSRTMTARSTAPDEFPAVTNDAVTAAPNEDEPDDVSAAIGAPATTELAVGSAPF